MTIPRHLRTHKPRRGPGQPPHQPTDVTRGQVEALAGFGGSHEDIGLVIGIDDKTLRKWYRHELDAGKAKANAKMAQNIFQKALGTGPQAATLAIFWAKTQMGWKEQPQQHALTGKDGEPLPGTSVNVYVPGGGQGDVAAAIEATRQKVWEKIQSMAAHMAEERIAASGQAGAASDGPPMLDITPAAGSRR